MICARRTFAAGGNLAALTALVVAVGCSSKDGDGASAGVDTEGDDGIGSLGGDADADGGDGDADAGDADDDGGTRLDALGDDAGDTDGMAECNRVLTATIRDFSSSHGDMEGTTGAETGIVQPDLGSDGIPVYAGNPTTNTTTGQANFDQWYRTTPSVNVELTRDIELTEVTPGVYGFDDSEFFPIDGDGLGNESNPHNYHFTLELRTEFTYEGEEIFYFRGDDDLFVFINGKLALDLGGVHGPLEGTIDLDAQAQDLGIQPGQTYALDFFFAERHTVQSNFRIETTIECLETPIG